MMREIRIEKVTLNIGCGTKLPVETAQKILEKISERKVVITHSKRRSTFNVPKNKPIGAKVTVRSGAEKLLQRLLEAKERRLSQKNFDDTGNFSFGIPEYIDVPNVEYDPRIGIVGFDVCVTLERAGYRIKRKKLAKHVGKAHRITKEETLDFAREKLGVVVE